MNPSEIERYSRQLLLPCIGTKGQIKICSGSVLVVGAGGTGSSCLLYLASAGVHTLGIVDYDLVEKSNLQRQIIHSEETIGLPKCHSASRAISKLNSLVRVTPYNTLLDSTNAFRILESYDVIVDCSDNAATRYLLNDACVILKKPLVCGSALKMDGQLTVYNHKGGPCYRCLFPVPPPPDTVMNCNQGGVLGVVPGLIGCLQALEVLKILTDLPTSSQKLLLVDAEAGTFRQVKLRGKSPSCVVCGENPSITSLIDYVQFCGSSAHDKTLELSLLKPEEQISVSELALHIQQSQPHLLLDVREDIQFQICSLPNSVHIPLAQLKSRVESLGNEVPIYVICRIGNDSQLAVQLLKANGLDRVWDVKGGLAAWTDSIDPSFPKY